MKTFLCSLLLAAIFLPCFATDYYSTGSVCPNLLTNWNTNPGGGGGTAGSFTNPGDRFIIQPGHTMITTAEWTIGGAGSLLQIQTGGTLRGDHVIKLTGTFQMDNGGTYIHNNTGPVSEAADSSIFSGSEFFAADSHFEIWKWPGKNTGLPNASPGISWGDLIINLQADISPDNSPWDWNLSDGSILTIQGDLDIRATYTNVNFPAELRLTPSGIHTINVAGNFLMSGSKTKVSIKSSSSQLIDGYTTMQVEGNILLTGASQLELGVNTTYPNPYGLYELRYKGNFLSTSAGGVLYSSGKSVSLAANGTTPQSFSSLWWLGSNFRVAPGATVNLASALTMAGPYHLLAIMGTLNQNGYDITVNGKIETAGGIFNSAGNVTIGGSCTACSNLNEIYNDGDNTWCTAAAGRKGVINFTRSAVSLNPFDTVSSLTAGSPVMNSPGDIYFENSTAVSFSEFPVITSFQVYENSVFSFDANSYVSGNAAIYQGKGGLLRIGSADGITAAGNITKGNIRTGLSKEYDFSGTNSFEYSGTNPQATGNGLPPTINGTLKINNSAGAGTPGVTLSQSTAVNGILYLSSGKLNTSLSSLLTLGDSGSVNLTSWGTSYVEGPMKKIGSTSFSFPIGRGNNYAPLALTGTGTVTDEYIAEYFMSNPVVMIGPAFDNPPIDHLFTKEWWTVDRHTGRTPKKVTLEATTYTNAILLSDLRIARWDGAVWKNEGNTSYSGVSAGPVTSNTVTIFFASGTATPFTFGTVTSYVDVLAINLISFDAIKLNISKALLSWEIATVCSPSAMFEIQKADGNSGFFKIGVVNGSATARSYNYTDNDLKKGISYYRLKITDEQGKITFSKIVTVMNGVNGILLTSLLPTIVTNSAMLTIASSGKQKLNLIIVDMQGKLIQRQELTVVAGNTTVQLSTERLAAGAYQIFGVTADVKTNIIRFIRL